MELEFNVHGHAVGVEIDDRGDALSIRVGERTLEVEAVAITERFVTLRLDGGELRVPYARDGRKLHVAHRGASYEIVAGGDEERESAETTGAFTPNVTSPMPGKVLEVLVAPGDEVEADAPMLLLEAMKMEQTVRSPGRARVVAIEVAAGDMVAPGQTLLVLEAESAETVEGP